MSDSIAGGDGCLLPRGFSEWGLGGVSRSEGRLFSCVASSSLSLLVVLHMESVGLSISGPSVRSLAQPVGFSPVWHASWRCRFERGACGFACISMSGVFSHSFEMLAAFFLTPSWPRPWRWGLSWTWRSRSLAHPCSSVAGIGLRHRLHVGASRAAASVVVVSVASAFTSLPSALARQITALLDSLMGRSALVPMGRLC